MHTGKINPELTLLNDLIPVRSTPRTFALPIAPINPLVVISLNLKKKVRNQKMKQSKQLDSVPKICSGVNCY